jgi:hypothetical protein
LTGNRVKGRCLTHKKIGRFAAVSEGKKVKELKEKGQPHREDSAEFERISNKYKAAVAKSKPLLEETYNDRNPNRFSESRKQPSLRDQGN